MCWTSDGGGGANVKRLLKLCPQGKVYGMDLSEESVAFARRHNAGELDRRCFIQQGDVCSLPYGDGAFDAVTAFETVYFWSSVSKALAEVFRVTGKGAAFSSVWKRATPNSERRGRSG